MNKKTIIIIIGIIALSITALVFISLNKSEQLNKCGDGICDEREKINPKLCPEDCKPASGEIETCGQYNNGYCIDFREECKTGYEDIGPDTCRRGRSAGCCVPKSPAKKTCAEQNGNFCSASQTCSGSWLDANDGEMCCGGECENSDVPYSFFFVHAECTESHGKCVTELKDKRGLVYEEGAWLELNNLVKLADKYNVPLTIMFWPTTVDVILTDQEKIITVKSWQANGHEIGIHVQYDDQGSFDPKDMNKYHELLDKKYQREIKSGTIVNKDRNTPKETIYDVDGRVCGHNRIF